MKRVLVRYLDRGLSEIGAVLVPDTLRRPVTFRTNQGGLTPSDATLPGLVLIGGDDLETLARAVGGSIIKVLRTPEVLWLPMNARKDFGSWTVECITVVDHMKLAAYSDDTIIRNSGIDPATGEPLRSDQ